MMLNRSALILRYERPFIDWINAADPAPDRAVSLDEANQEPTVYLVDEVDGESDLDQWLQMHHQELFERELHAWLLSGDQPERCRILRLAEIRPQRPGGSRSIHLLRHGT